jgi:hypothetical protein
VDKENFSSHYVVINILSNFSKVDVAKLFAHVYFLPDICSSLRLRPSMATLNRNGHLALKQSLFFSRGCLRML